MSVPAQMENLIDMCTSFDGVCRRLMEHLSLKHNFNSAKLAATLMNVVEVGVGLNRKMLSFIELVGEAVAKRSVPHPAERQQLVTTRSASRRRCLRGRKSRLRAARRHGGNRRC